VSDDLSSRVDRLETDVQRLLDRPQNPGFSQVIGTLLATLGACAIVFAFAKFHLYEAITPVTQSVTMLQQKFDASERMALEARVELEKRTYEVRIESEKMANESRIQSAVLEERTNWMRSQGGWKPE
jgi:hypothetical protein